MIHSGEAVWFLVQGYGLTASLVAHLTQLVHSCEDLYATELHVIKNSGLQKQLFACAVSVFDFISFFKSLLKAKCPLFPHRGLLVTTNQHMHCQE